LGRRAAAAGAADLRYHVRLPRLQPRGDGRLPAGSAPRFPGRSVPDRARAPRLEAARDPGRDARAPRGRAVLSDGQGPLLSVQESARVAHGVAEAACVGLTGGSMHLTKIQLISAAGALVLALAVLDLVRRRRLSEEYSLLWVISTLVVAVLGFSPPILTAVTQ